MRLPMAGVGCPGARRPVPPECVRCSYWSASLFMSRLHWVGGSGQTSTGVARRSRKYSFGSGSPAFNDKHKRRIKPGGRRAALWAPSPLDSLSASALRDRGGEALCGSTSQQARCSFLAFLKYYCIYVFDCCFPVNAFVHWRAGVDLSYRFIHTFSCQVPSKLSCPFCIVIKDSCFHTLCPEGVYWRLGRYNNNGVNLMIEG